MKCNPLQRLATKNVKGPSVAPGQDFKSPNENIMKAQARRLGPTNKLSGEVGVSNFKGFVPDFCAPGRDPFQGNYEGVSSLQGGFVPKGTSKVVNENMYSLYDKRPKALSGSMVDLYCSSVRTLK